MLSRVILLAFLAAQGLVEAGFITKPDVLFAPGALIARQNGGGKGRGGGGQGAARGGNGGGGQGKGNNNNNNNKAGGGGGGNNNNNNNNGGGGGGNNNGGGCLDQSIISKASNKDGQEPGTDGIKAGQAKSLKDPFNFVNFCVGKGAITDGLQKKGGSCSTTPMGQIPSVDKMTTVMITNPKTGEKLQARKTFNIDVQTRNLQTGSFTNPTTTYYTAPQFLNQQGVIVGHVHVTCQNIGNLNPSQPPDAKTFAFFKGIDEAGKNGLVSATVEGGLPAGTFRCCTITSGSNHQPVYMPVAQRGAQEDCTKFEVADNGGGGNGGNGGNGGQNQNKGNGQNQNKGNAQGQNRGKGQQQGRGRRV
ncbi:hypothetical protein MAPG_00160 [Magnaporthiopsis poae ATCC 64411]|uniref:Ribosomal protein s17 n=1 Tax=Magnaporthiopsis poae (strain ATCC 64411 / 73-15) TaxID=644358 RepID=A0A0C4DK96_MAGP6|nr:hypothetical protein MAPG_00160 [Magnaporthiopsis poae ATCC 64411]